MECFLPLYGQRCKCWDGSQYKKYPVVSCQYHWHLDLSPCQESVNSTMEWRRGNTTLVLYWRMMGGRLLLTLCTAYYQAATTARRKLTAKNGVCYQMQIFEWCISKCVTFTMCFTHDTTNHMRHIGYWQSHLNWIKFSLFLPSNTFLSITLQCRINIHEEVLVGILVTYVFVGQAS